MIPEKCISSFNKFILFLFMDAVSVKLYRKHLRHKQEYRVKNNIYILKEYTIAV